MIEPLTTNGVRKILVAYGAKHPSRRAVQMVATKIDSIGDAELWELNVPEDLIRSAVVAAAGLRGEDSYAAFRKSLHSPPRSR
jgi:hypothetical protein